MKVIVAIVIFVIFYYFSVIQKGYRKLHHAQPTQIYLFNNVNRYNVKYKEVFVVSKKKYNGNMIIL